MPVSGPCVTCKQRRIKCDGDWPICQRCEKSSRECLRPSSSSLAVVSENKYAAGKVKRPRGPRLRRATAPTTVIQDLHSKALKNYLDNHATPPTELDVDISGSLSACVLAWQKTANTSRLVELALLAMALAVYGKTKSHPEATAEAFSIYHELLKLTQQHIARPTLDVASIDACLLTVFLMGRCESAMHKTLSPDAEDLWKGLKSWSHHDGAMALLKLWHMHFKGQETSMIVKQSRRGMLKSLLLRKMAVPDWLRNGDNFGGQGLELGYDSIFVRLVNIRWEMKLNTSSAGETSWINLRDQITTLDVDLYDFRKRLPEQLTYHEHQVTDFNTFWIRIPNLRIYSTPAHAILYAHILATRLVSIFTYMTDLSYSAETSAEAEGCPKMLQHLANELAAIVPNCIGLIDQDGEQISMRTADHMKPSQVSSVVWPLSMAASIHGYDEELRRGFQSQLTKIGEMIGDGVLQSASAEDWPLL